MLVGFREGGKEERDREISIGCFLYSSHQVSNLKPRHVPDQESNSQNGSQEGAPIH